MGRGKHSDKPFANMQRNRHFRECGLLAGGVILVLAYVGRIAHLAGGGHISHHAFLPNLQTVPLAMDAASVHARHYHLSAAFVMQVNARFQATKRTRNIVHNSVNKLIEVEDRADLLRSLLQSLQIFYLVAKQGTNRNKIVPEYSGSCGHRRPSPWA